MTPDEPAGRQAAREALGEGWQRFDEKTRHRRR